MHQQAATSPTSSDTATGPQTSLHQPIQVNTAIVILLQHILVLIIIVHDMILFSLFQLLSSIKLKSNLPSFLDKPKYPNPNQPFWHRDLSPQKSKWDGSGFNISKHPFKPGPHEHIQHEKGSPSIFYLGKRPKLVALPMPTHPIRLGLFGTQKMIFKSIFWIKDIDLSTGHFTLARYEGALRKVLSRTRDRLQKSRGLAK